jgi:hypothetical protein
MKYNVKQNDIVCNSQLSQRLNAAGITQKSYFYWEETETGWICVPEILINYQKKHISAYTATELIAMFPSYLKVPRKTENCTYVYEKSGRIWEFKTFTDAIADMILFLINNNFTTVNNINSDYENH